MVLLALIISRMCVGVIPFNAAGYLFKKGAQFSCIVQIHGFERDIYMF